VYEKWKGTGVRFVGLGLLDNEVACRAFVQRHHLSFPNGYDKDGRIAGLYGFTHQPYWAVIDAQGGLMQTGYGPENEDELVATIKTLTKR
jgi:hypothetical protein